MAQWMTDDSAAVIRHRSPLWDAELAESLLLCFMVVLRRAPVVKEIRPR